MAARVVRLMFFWGGTRARRARACMQGSGPRARTMRIVSFDVGVRNFAVCVITVDAAGPVIETVHHWEVIDIQEEAGRNCRTVEDKKRALLQALLRRRDLLCDGLSEGDAVVIEQQPLGRGYGSPAMNILAHTIGTFFVLMAPEAKPVCSIRQVPARTKLELDVGRYGVEGFHYGGPSNAAATSATWKFQLDPGATWDAGGCDAAVSCGWYDRDTGRGAALFARARKSGASVAKALGLPTDCKPEPATGDYMHKNRTRGNGFGRVPTTIRKSSRRRATHERYRHNKGLSVAMCAALFDATPAFEPWRELFETSGKKDDLADCMTQALVQV